ncbi:MAG: hypothetical protein WA366_14160 [Pseudolabrys sp.]
MLRERFGPSECLVAAYLLLPYSETPFLQVAEQQKAGLEVVIALNLRLQHFAFEDPQRLEKAEIRDEKAAGWIEIFEKAVCPMFPQH